MANLPNTSIVNNSVSQIWHFRFHRDASTTAPQIPIVIGKIKIILTIYLLRNKLFYLFPFIHLSSMISCVGLLLFTITLNYSEDTPVHLRSRI